VPISLYIFESGSVFAAEKEIFRLDAW